ncbi:MAG: hypothetical protein IJZ37_02655, partial [Clostridia bacterium]|nr:hypothetical protein [Clostridia bacterium]
VADDKNREPADRYSKQSYTQFCAVLERVRTIVNSGDASQEDVESLKAELTNACKALVDMSALLDKIDLLGSYSAQSYYYTPESYDALLTAISEGISLVKSEAPTAEQLALAGADIDHAISALVRKALTADGKKDKQLLYRVIMVGNSRILLGTYLDDYVSFFETVDHENMNLSYQFVGEDGVEFSADETKILMREGYMKISYVGSAPVDEANAGLASIGGIHLAHTEFDVAAETSFGAPSEYTKRTEVVMGQENTIAVLTYENESEGVKVIFEYNTIGNYISSMEIIKTTV